jgi:hypothetical protein
MNGASTSEWVPLHPKLHGGRELKACYINTKDQLVVLLTKPLRRIKFLELYSRIRMVQLSHKITQDLGENDKINLILLIFIILYMVVKRTTS